ncbi:MAG: hypothetical protein A4E55_01681 [Pelotomaculum sp. PtaU1.Bin035]|nr:MAG: hypothetical protein A4E55_01681 [Pelotomaculum sp. PtaU1.Bin035]
MEYIWLLLIMFIIFRSIKILAKRSRIWAKPGGPRDGPPFKREEQFTERSPYGEPCENELVLNIPGYLAGSAGPTAAGDNNVNTCQDLHGRHGGSELFDGIVCPGQFFKGMVWSQILGARGGLQAKKR